MVPSARPGVSLLTAALLLLTACSSSTAPTDPSFPSGARLNAFAEPPTVPAAPPGATTGGCTQVTAELLDVTGRLVDGVLVRFTATLGTFAGAGAAAVREVLSVRGVAAVSFCAGSTPGTARVAVAAENAVTTVLIPVL